MSTDPVVTPSLLVDVQRLIVEARQRLATTVNAELTLLYWRIGQRIRALGERRHTDSKQSVARSVSAQQ